MGKVVREILGLVWKLLAVAFRRWVRPRLARLLLWLALALTVLLALALVLGLP